MTKILLAYVLAAGFFKEKIVSLLSAKTKPKMLFNSLRRGFCSESIMSFKSEDYGSPEDVRGGIINRIEQLAEHKSILLCEMGFPNKDNLRKYKGREHKHDQWTTLKAYFDTGDKIEELKTKSRLIRDFIKERNTKINNKDANRILINELRKKVGEDVFMSCCETSKFKAKMAEDLECEEWKKFIEDNGL